MGVPKSYNPLQGEISRVSNDSCRQLSADRCRQMSVECRPIVARVSADSGPSIGRDIGRVSADSVGR